MIAWNKSDMGREEPLLTIISKAICPRVDPLVYLFFLLLVPVSVMPISCDQPSSKTNTGDWSFGSQRNDIAPEWFMDDKIKCDGRPTLVLAGNGTDRVNGYWYAIKEVEARNYYHFRVKYLAEQVEEESRSVLARIIWQDDQGKVVGQAEYPATNRKTYDDGWRVIEQIYKVPEHTETARIELIYRWDADGTVRFGGFSFEATNDPGKRIVRLASIHFRPNNTKGARDNLHHCSKYLEMAAEQEADIVCLPEAITLVGTGKSYVEASEPVPGKTTEYLGEIARRHSMYIVAGLLEREGDAVYNTSVLLDREGDLAGKYRKVCLPREEIEGGITPGNALPVFETDFGRIGMMICWDVTFPEVARTLSSKGAEVILMPIWGGNIILAKARCIENQVYMVTSSYDMKSAVFDQEGEILAEAIEREPVVVVEVDLNQQKLWPWLGDLKNRIPREMPAKEALSLDED
jgi:predicted amidohydrolase